VALKLSSAQLKSISFLLLSDRKSQKAAEKKEEEHKERVSGLYIELVTSVLR